MNNYCLVAPDFCSDIKGPHLDSQVDERKQRILTVIAQFE